MHWVPDLRAGGFAAIACLGHGAVARSCFPLLTSNHHSVGELAHALNGLLRKP